MGFEVEVAGVVSTRERLQALVHNLGEMDDLWARYAEVMVETETEWFATEGDGLWPPLAKSTVQDKARYEWPEAILFRRGRLFESLTDPLEAMSIDEPGAARSTLGTFLVQSMTWGTSVEDDRGREFAHFHQHTIEGTMIERDYGGRPPLRQVIPLPLPLTTISAMRDADDAWIAETLAKSGLH